MDAFLSLVRGFARRDTAPAIHRRLNADSIMVQEEPAQNRQPGCQSIRASAAAAPALAPPAPNRPTARLASSRAPPRGGHSRNESPLMYRRTADVQPEFRETGKDE